MSVTNISLTVPLASLQDAERERDKFKKDATRYNWLRGRNLECINDGGVFAGQIPENIVLNGVDLDEAIDEALANLPGGNEQPTEEATASPYDLSGIKEFPGE